MHCRIILACLPATSLQAAAPDLSKKTSRTELDAIIASTPDSALKHALEAHGAAIPAIEQRPHIEAVTRIVEGARGRVEKINTTLEDLRETAGGTCRFSTR